MLLLLRVLQRERHDRSTREPCRGILTPTAGGEGWMRWPGGPIINSHGSAGAAAGDKWTDLQMIRESLSPFYRWVPSPLCCCLSTYLPGTIKLLLWNPSAECFITTLRILTTTMPVTVTYSFFFCVAPTAYGHMVVPGARDQMRLTDETLSHSCSNTRSSTHCTTVRTPQSSLERKKRTHNILLSHTQPQRAGIILMLQMRRLSFAEVKSLFQGLRAVKVWRRWALNPTLSSSKLLPLPITHTASHRTLGGQATSGILSMHLLTLPAHLVLSASVNSVRTGIKTPLSLATRDHGWGLLQGASLQTGTFVPRKGKRKM